MVVSYLLGWVFGPFLVFSARMNFGEKNPDVIGVDVVENGNRKVGKFCRGCVGGKSREGRCREWQNCMQPDWLDDRKDGNNDNKDDG